MADFLFFNSIQLLDDVVAMQYNADHRRNGLNALIRHLPQGLEFTEQLHKLN